MEKTSPAFTESGAFETLRSFSQEERDAASRIKDFLGLKKETF